MKEIIKQMMIEYMDNHYDQFKDLSKTKINQLLEVEGCKLCNLPHAPVESIIGQHEIKAA